MSRPLWYAIYALAGSAALIKLIEMKQKSDAEKYKQKLISDNVRVIQENLTVPIVKG